MPQVPSPRARVVPRVGSRGVISLFKQLNLKQEPGLLFHLFTPFFFPSLLLCLYTPAVQGQGGFRHVLDVCVTWGFLLPSAVPLLPHAASARGPGSPCENSPSTPAVPSVWRWQSRSLPWWEGAQPCSPAQAVLEAAQASAGAALLNHPFAVCNLSLCRGSWSTRGRFCLILLSK